MKGLIKKMFKKMLPIFEKVVKWTLFSTFLVLIITVCLGVVHLLFPLLGLGIVVKKLLIVCFGGAAVAVISMALCCVCDMFKH